MSDPAALDERARQLRLLALDVDGCADAAVRRAASPHWVSPHADDVRAALTLTQTRARQAADDLRIEAGEAERQAGRERARRAEEQRARGREAALERERVAAAAP